MSKFYRKIVNRYIEQNVKMSNYAGGDSEEVIFFLSFLDLFADVCYFIFGVFASISMYFLLSREVIPYVQSL